MKFQTLAVAILGLSVVASGCSSITSEPLQGEVAIAASQEAETKTTEITSQDGAVQIETPSTWQTDELNEADVQRNTIVKASTQGGDIQLNITQMPTDGITLDMYSEVVSMATKAMVGSEGVTAPTSLTTVNGMPSKQYEGHGKFAGHDLAALVTGIQTPEMYYNIIVVAKESEFDNARAELDQIIQSFQLVESNLSQVN